MESPPLIYSKNVDLIRLVNENVVIRRSEVRGMSWLRIQNARDRCCFYDR